MERPIVQRQRNSIEIYIQMGIDLLEIYIQYRNDSVISIHDLSNIRYCVA